MYEDNIITTTNLKGASWAMTAASCLWLYFYILKVAEAENLNLFQNSDKLKIYANISLRYVNGLL